MNDLSQYIAAGYSILSELSFTFIGTKMVGKLAPAKGFFGKARNLGIGYILAITVKSLVAEKVAESCVSTADQAEKFMDLIDDLVAKVEE